MNDDLIGSTRCPTCKFQKTSQMGPCIRCEPMRPLFHELADSVMESLRGVIVGALAEMEKVGRLTQPKPLFAQLNDRVPNQRVCDGYHFDYFVVRDRGGPMGIDYQMLARRGDQERVVTRSPMAFHRASTGAVVHEMLSELEQSFDPEPTGITLVVRKLEALLVEIDRGEALRLAVDQGTPRARRIRELCVAALAEAIKLEKP